MKQLLYYMPLLVLLILSGCAKAPIRSMKEQAETVTPVAEAPIRSMKEQAETVPPVAEARVKAGPSRGETGQEEPSMLKKAAQSAIDIAADCLKLKAAEKACSLIPFGSSICIQAARIKFNNIVCANIPL